MPKPSVSRRHFFGASTLGPIAAVSLMNHPARLAAQAAGIKSADLPDLTVKEVKVYVLDRGQVRSGVTSAGYARIASIVTHSGIEGNYTLADRYWHPDWNNQGWLPYAKALLAGKSVLDLPALTSQWEPQKRRRGQSSYASAIDNCLWDILGKAEGFKAYKIHPPGPRERGGRVDYKLDMEVAKAVRKAAGDGFILLMDPVGVYTREEAMKVGRLMDQLDFVAYEDPIPTTDIEGLAELCRALDVPIHIGEFIFSIYDYPEYIRRGAVDVLRLIVDNIGGLTGAMKVAHLAECFGMECAPHNWGEVFDHAVHFHCELAMPNNVWFEMTAPQGAGDRPYMKDRIRIAKDGYVYAPTKPGLGYELDRDALDKMTRSIERQ